MNRIRLAPLAFAVAAILATPASAFAQQLPEQPRDAAAPPTTDGAAATDNAQASPAVQELDAVKVTGYRASLQKSLNIKRNADAIVDAISAEDVGKFPAANVAESLSHLPGVSVDRQFGEGEKVSILGTDPALNRVLLNGQSIASTSWGGDPNNPDSRSFNYSLLAPEVIGSAEVYKSPQPSIDEGSLGGTVILHTRKPLELDKNLLTGSVSYGYNDRSEDGKPNASLLYNWKNDAGTLGVLGSVMHSERSLRRDGVEIFGYSDIQGAGFPDAVAAGKQGVYPTAINSALFTQTRKRDGVTGSLQWKPNDAFELTYTGLYVEETFDNVNQSRYANFVPANATALDVTDGVATSGAYGGNAETILDSYVRNTTVKTSSNTLRGDWHGDGWNVSGQVGATRSAGGADRIYGLTFRGNGGYDYAIDHRRVGVDYAVPPSALDTMSVIGATVNRYPNLDKERYAQLDFDHDVAWGPITKLRLGVKATRHSTAQDMYYDSFPADPNTTLGAVYGGDTPGGYLDGLSVSDDMRHWPRQSPGALIDYVSGLPGSDILAPSYGSTFDVVERNRAAYLQADFSGYNYRGNIGVRYVNTRDAIGGYQYDGSAYAPVRYNKSYGEWLPSLNFAYDLSDALILRVAAAKVIARPRYADLTPYVNADDNKLTASSGNPALDPYRSTNYGASLEWYFAPNSVLAGELFYRDISNYILQTLVQRPLHNNTYDREDIYEVTLPQNSGAAKVKGVSLSYQQELGGGFGVAANYTYSKADTQGDYNLPYNSKNSYNLSPYFEKGPWEARLTLGWRSAYFTQIGRLGANQMTDAFTQLDASVSYAITDKVKLQLEGSNLLDETYYSYVGQESQPYYLYKNGRGYMLSVHFTL
ncbi:TonB-dependent receptor [Xanthomonas sp. NCPPB 2654]|uniref:TonB-dependent receptor n=1 Tax=unclassified Xanthomonas TaxID=2643310 RepID=UPI0021DF634E|nr:MULTISPECIES: TonB-dependent receptor [unclassified Xanthomonas]MDL5367894.1 TonB-dependent receptor [Xanthomonas sp. NCPPB 2654]UYC19565.1 TonB-dependent receptor [Xanthomonas sp. CFBP 8443]